MNELLNMPCLFGFTTIEFVLSHGFCGTIQVFSEHSLMVMDFRGVKFVPTRVVEPLTITL